MLLYKLDTPALARGVSSNSASSDMSQTLGAPSKELIEAGRIPEPYRSCDAVIRGRVSIARGLRVRLGDRSGEGGQARGIEEGERVRFPIGCMTVGSEWARVIGGE